jgi:phosphoglycolate phosphatase
MCSDSPTPDPAPALAWLFDVDGTLLSTEGAAREAFARTVEDVFGVPGDLGAVPFAGRIEPRILADILAHLGRTLDEDGEARFWNTVFDHMRRLLTPPRGRLLPGVAGLVERVAAEPRWLAGLLTGNMTQMAAIKLERFGLEGRFAFGAFGEMAADRNGLARLAVERLRAAYGIAAARCIVVGDTEHDIACARAAGARAVAVATGARPRAVLAAHAPDLLLDDLADPGPLLDFAARVEAGAVPA